MTITLRNDFHGTEARVIPQSITEGRYAGYYMISRRTARRLHDALCGSSDCCCSGALGDREDTWDGRAVTRVRIINEDYHRNYIVEVN